jgi:hypothetical protein
MKTAYLLLVAICVIPPMAVAQDASKDHFIHTLYLIRHGAYDTEATADPETGPDLTPLGIAQARLVAARLRGVPVHWDSMTSSTMARAREPARWARTRHYLSTSNQLQMMSGNFWMEWPAGFGTLIKREFPRNVSGFTGHG